MRVMGVNFSGNLYNFKNNIRRSLHYIEVAGKKGADMVVFPELSLSGYPNGMKTFNYINARVIDVFRKAARDNRVVALVGAIEREEGFRYISQFVFFPDGRVEKYRKSHLGKEEGKFFKAGDKVEVFQDGDMRFGIQICYDSHFPELSTIQAMKKAQILIMPFCFPYDRRHIWGKYLVARAYDNSVNLFALNQLGFNGKRFYQGGMLAIDMKGNIIKESYGKENIFIVDFPKEIVYPNSSMKNRRFIEQRRPEIYSEIVRR